MNKKILKECKFACCEQCEINNTQVRAIEHLIQENKELKEENLELHKEINQRIKLKLENEKCADKDFIPKSKVKEKIEELDKRDLDSQTKIDYASVYFNAYKFFKIQDYEHNIEVMNKDVKNRKFNKEK